MVTKEHSEYYWLRYRYMLRNLITGREAIMNGYSRPTKHKCRGEELEILCEQLIDRDLNRLAVYLRNDNTKEWKLQWVLVEILKEEWQKL